MWKERVAGGKYVLSKFGEWFGEWFGVVAVVAQNSGCEYKIAQNCGMILLQFLLGGMTGSRISYY